MNRYVRTQMRAKGIVALVKIYEQVDVTVGVQDRETQSYGGVADVGATDIQHPRDRIRKG